MDDCFLRQRLESIKAMIVAYETAILFLQTAEGNYQSYTLNTGQSTQTVTRYDLNRLKTTYDSLLNQYATMQARLCGSGVVISGPAW